MDYYGDDWLSGMTCSQGNENEYEPPDWDKLQRVSNKINFIIQCMQSLIVLADKIYGSECLSEVLIDKEIRESVDKIQSRIESIVVKKVKENG